MSQRRSSSAFLSALHYVIDSVQSATDVVTNLASELLNSAAISGGNGSAVEDKAARVHARAVLDRPAAYSDWERSTIDYSDIQYERGTLLGRGKYSHVHEICDKRTGATYVAKIFKPQKSKKYKREVLVLKNLQGGPNIVRFIGCCLDPEANEPAIIFERRINVNWKEFYPKMSYEDARHYMHALMLALSSNKTSTLSNRLGTGGLLSTTRGIQLTRRISILQTTGNSLRLSKLFRREVFFQGDDDVDQLRVISRVLGGEGLRDYVGRYKIALPDDAVRDLVANAKNQRQPLYEFVGWSNAELAREDAIDMVEKLLKYDHQERLTADECLSHPFLLDAARVAAPVDPPPRVKTPPLAEVTQEEDEEEGIDFIFKILIRVGLTPPLMNPGKMLAEEDPNDTEVSWEDQSNINNFAKMNARMTELEDASSTKKKAKEDLEDLETDLELADEDEPVKYKLGDAFVELSLTECQERMAADKKKLGDDISAIESEMSDLQKTMADLKTVLYKRFGKSINLEIN